MARIRTIKPEFFRHLELYYLEKETGLPLRVAFPGLWTVADREGRFRWQPEVLKLDVLPFDDLDFSRVLDALLTRGFIVKYEVSGKRYGYIPTFKEHQFINNKETPSILPPPPEISENIEDSTCESRVNNATQTRLYAQEREREEYREREKEEKTSCSEPEKKPGSDRVLVPSVISIPLLSKKDEPLQFDVTQPMIDEWVVAFPAVDVLQELRFIREWNLSNPTRRKTPTGIRKHITTWLTDKQNKGGLGRLQASKGGNGSAGDGFKTLITTGDKILDVSMTNAANFVKRRMEGNQIAE